MGRGTRAKKKTLEAVAQYEEIKRQKALKERPFRSVIYQGKKAITVARKKELGRQRAAD